MLDAKKLLKRETSLAHKSQAAHSPIYQRLFIKYFIFFFKLMTLHFQKHPMDLYNYH